MNNNVAVFLPLVTVLIEYVKKKFDKVLSNTG